MQDETDDTFHLYNKYSVFLNKRLVRYGKSRYYSFNFLVRLTEHKEDAFDAKRTDRYKIPN